MIQNQVLVRWSVENDSTNFCRRGLASEQQIKSFGKVDVALTPIGGGRTMGPELAREVLAQIKPKIAIPMHHRDSPYQIKQFSAGIKTQILKSDTLAVSKDALPPSPEIRVLQPRGAMSYE